MAKLLQLIDLLGRTAEDRVTGFRGVMASISFDLYGCVQVVLTPRMQKDGTTPDGKWFDTNRLINVSEVKVMERPDFVNVQAGEPEVREDKGPCEKPTKW